MAIDFDWLEKVLSRSLGEEERDALGCLGERSYESGETIITQGDPGGTLYLLRSGATHVEDTHDGVRVRVGRVEEGSLFGEMSFMSNREATAEVVAAEPCVVYTLTRNDFSRLMHEHQGLVCALFTTMLDNQARTIQQMNARLVPMLRNLKVRAASLPLAVKLFPIIFIVIYVLAFLYISWKDFSY